MTASFNLTLDTRAPANATLLISGGAAVTGEPLVWVLFTSTDLLTGANDVAQMKVWGDVEWSADPTIAIIEAESAWIPFTEQIAVMLSAGTGRKYLYARFRDDVGNVTLPFTDFIDLNTTVPVVKVTTAVDRSRISKVVPYNAATFTWDANVAFVAYQVRVVPSPGSPQQAGVMVGSAGGSVNVSGTGAFVAQVPIITTIRGADLETASPGDTIKVLKIFVQNGAGVWSA